MIPEAIVIAYLTAQLSVPVYAEVPEDPPASFVTVERTGSGKRNRIYSATFAIQSWAESMLDAAQLNESVIDAMDAIVELNDVMSSRLNSAYNYTDQATGKYRYQAVYDLVF